MSALTVAEAPVKLVGRAGGADMVVSQRSAPGHAPENDETATGASGAVKTCVECFQEKPASSFYARRAKCRSCHLKRCITNQRARRARGGKKVKHQNHGGQLPSFKQRTDPLVRRAMRRLFDHGCSERHCSHLPANERSALDAWLDTRTEFLARGVSDALREHEPSLRFGALKRPPRIATSTAEARMAVGVR